MSVVIHVHTLKLSEIQNELIKWWDNYKLYYMKIIFLIKNISMFSIKILIKSIWNIFKINYCSKTLRYFHYSFKFIMQYMTNTRSLVTSCITKICKCGLRKKMWSPNTRSLVTSSITKICKWVLRKKMWSYKSTNTSKYLHGEIKIQL